MIEILSWLAMVCTLISAYLLAKKMKSGWVLGIIGCVIWIVYSITTTQPALALTNVVILGIDAYGFYKWTK